MRNGLVKNRTHLFLSSLTPPSSISTVDSVQMILSLFAITPHINANPNLNPSPHRFLRATKQSITLFLKPLNASSSLSSSSSSSSSIPNSSLRRVTRTLPSDESEGDEEEPAMVSSASAIATAIRRSSTSPVEFMQIIEKDHRSQSKLIMPSPDFQRLCLEQFELFRRIVEPDAVLSVYLRPAGSYVMDRLELRRVTCSYQGVNVTDIVILIGDFRVPAGLRAAEATLSSQQVEVVPEHRAVIFPIVKHPFVLGFLVAELPQGKNDEHGLVHVPSPEEAYALPINSDVKSPETQFQSFDSESRMTVFTSEQRSNAINIVRSLAMAYVMDQKAMLLQQSSWQNNVRMSNLVEQIRGPLSSIRTLSKMLSIHTKRSEILYDIVEDILVQGERIKDTLQELQAAVYLTKSNIVRYNEETFKKWHGTQHESKRSQLANDFSMESSGKKLQSSLDQLSLNSGAEDFEMPMRPLALASLQQNGIRPCTVSDVLLDMVEAVKPLASKQQRTVELTDLSQSLKVAIEELALRQALSNLIEGALLRTSVGGKVNIVSSRAPEGGALILIDDDGPDMHYMTQTHSLTPFGIELLTENIEDNMTWNFVAGLTVAREILESYSCLVRVMSPRVPDAVLGAGGTRVELWIPPFNRISDSTQERT